VEISCRLGSLASGGVHVFEFCLRCQIKKMIPARIINPAAAQPAIIPMSAVLDRGVAEWEVAEGEGIVVVVLDSLALNEYLDGESS